MKIQITPHPDTAKETKYDDMERAAIDQPGIGDKKSQTKKFDDSEIADSFHTLSRAEDIKANPELMKHVRAHAKKKADQITSIKDLRKKREKMNGYEPKKGPNLRQLMTVSPGNDLKEETERGEDPKEEKSESKAKEKAEKD